MAYIETIPQEQAEGDVRAMYERQQSHAGYLPNYARVFCYRPDVMRGWADLQASIRSHVDARRFELVTVAAAQAMGNTACTLAHGRKLTQFMPEADVIRIAQGDAAAVLSPAEVQMLQVARKVARDATAVSADDIAVLKVHGFADDEIFDIIAIAAARAFFTKVLDGLGTTLDEAFDAISPQLKAALTPK